MFIAIHISPKCLPWVFALAAMALGAGIGVLAS